MEQVDVGTGGALPWEPPWQIRCWEHLATNYPRLGGHNWALLRALHVCRLVLAGRPRRNPKTGWGHSECWNSDRRAVGLEEQSLSLGDTRTAFWALFRYLLSGGTPNSLFRSG